MKVFPKFPSVTRFSFYILFCILNFIKVSTIKLMIPQFFFFYLFLAALGLCCCAWAFSSCGERGLLFVVVRGLVIVVASLVAEHGL